jgi:Tfp pilus assembly protein PilN
VSQVNLLPPDILQRQKVRQRTVAVMLIGAAAVGVVLFFWVLQSARLAGVNHDITNQSRNNEAIQAQITALQQYAALAQEAQAKLGTLQAAYAYDASFSTMLEDVSEVIPSDQFLTSLNFQITPPATTSGTTTIPSVIVGSMKANGTAAALDTISSWLTRCDSVRGWTNAWFTTATRDPNTGLWTFSSGLDLTQQVLSSRGQKGIG